MMGQKLRSFYFAGILTTAFSQWGCAEKSPEENNSPESSLDVRSGGQPDSEIERTSASGTVDDGSAIQLVHEAVEALRYDDFLGGNADIDQIEHNLQLPTSIEIHRNGVANLVVLDWRSAHPNINANGVIKRLDFGQGVKKGILQVSARFNRAVAYRSFALTVPEIEPSDLQAVTSASEALSEEYIRLANTSLNSVRTNLRMPYEFLHGTTIKWSSSLPAIEPTGVVTRPPYAANPPNPIGTLRALISRGEERLEKTFTVRVMRLFPELMITEIGLSRSQVEGFVEVFNTTDRDLQLADYQFSTCGMASHCVANRARNFPPFVLKSQTYVLLKAYASGKKTIDTAEAVYVDAIQFSTTGFFEILRAGKTIDFVRWRTDSAEQPKIVPQTGTFNGAVNIAATTDKYSIGRLNPYEDSDGSVEWASFPTPTAGRPNGTGASPTTDTDGDGLTDDQETGSTGTNPLIADTDGDGFTDGQEVLAEGVMGLNLAELGAQPLVRDIFVEIDYMQNPRGVSNNRYDSLLNPATLALRKAALDKVHDVFAAFVPSQFDASPYPIKIHLDVGDLFDQSAGENRDNYDLGGGNYVPFQRCLFLGIDNLRNSSNCANLYDLKQEHFSSARQQVFRYMVIGWSMEVDGRIGQSGIGEIRGNDSLVTIGNWGNLPEQMIINWQAATILHEIGHNLGLDHGGNRITNYKPNYVSSMNYFYQLNGLDIDRNGDVFAYEMGEEFPGYRAELDIPHDDEKFVIGFSRGNAPTLNEASVIEAQGIGGVGIDFDGDGVINQAPRGVNLQPAKYNRRANEVHSDYDDWANLHFKFQGGFGLQLFDDAVDSANLPTSADDVGITATECRSVSF